MSSTRPIWNVKFSICRVFLTSSKNKNFFLVASINVTFDVGNAKAMMMPGNPAPEPISATLLPEKS